MDEDKKPQPKINTIFVVLGFVAFIIFDLLSLIPVVADVLEIPDGIIFVVGIVTGLGPTFIITEAIADLIKLFPALQEFPVWTIAWLIVVFMDRRPSKLTAGVQKLAQSTSALEGNVEELGEEGAEAAEATAQREAAAETEKAAQESAEQAERATGQENPGAQRRGSRRDGQEGEESVSEDGSEAEGGPDEELGGKREVMDELQKNLFEEGEASGQNEEGEEDDEEDNNKAGSPRKVTDISVARKAMEQKAKEVSENLKKVKPGGEVEAA